MAGGVLTGWYGTTLLLYCWLRMLTLSVGTAAVAATATALGARSRDATLVRLASSSGDEVTKGPGTGALILMLALRWSTERSEFLHDVRWTLLGCFRRLLSLRRRRWSSWSSGRQVLRLRLRLCSRSWCNRWSLGDGSDLRSLRRRHCEIRSRSRSSWSGGGTLRSLRG